MARKNTDIMMTGQQGEQLRNKYSDRLRRFMEAMSDIYGEETANNTPATELVARHRDVAEKLLGKRNSRKEEDFFAVPKTKVLN